jgi:hypothetical protein
MAITTTFENLGSGETVLLKFAGITQGDTTTPFEFYEYADRSVQVAGTFAGSTVLIEGSNDGTNWATLNDAQAQPLSIATAGRIEQIMEVSRFCRVSCATSTGANLAATFLLRRATPMRT